MLKLRAIALTLAVVTLLQPLAKVDSAAAYTPMEPQIDCKQVECTADLQLDASNPTVDTPSKSQSSHSSDLPELDIAANVQRCREVSAVSVVGPDHCEPSAAPTGTITPVPDGPTETQLRTVATQLKLPDATPRFGPDPSVNEWKMLAVGYPIWLWTDRPTHLTTTAHHDGLDFALTATWTSTTFTMGDGKTKTCTATTIRPKQLKPATTPSPTCGYVYQTRSKPGHPYTVVAATHWQINWATNGYTGTFTHTYTGSRTLDIGELHSLING